MEKGDGLAMLIAALITIVPICLVVLAMLALAGYFLHRSDKEKASLLSKERDSLFYLPTALAPTSLKEGG